MGNKLSTAAFFQTILGTTCLTTKMLHKVFATKVLTISGDGEPKMHRLDTKTSIMNMESGNGIGNNSNKNNSSSSSSSSSNRISGSSGSSSSSTSSIAHIVEAEKDGSKQKQTPRDYSTLLKYVSLLVLILQNATLVLVTRYTTTRTQKAPFLKTVAIFFIELIKIVVATMLYFLTTWPPKKALRDLREKFSLMDTLKLGIPALCYTIQGVLFYVAIENLDTGTFIVTYQLKILTTAFFTVLILKRRLSVFQWAALVLLIAGIATVQISADQENKKPVASMPSATPQSQLALLANGTTTKTTYLYAANSNNTNVINNSSNKMEIEALLLNATSNGMWNGTTTNDTYSYLKKYAKKQQNVLTGFLSVLVLCFLSGFAGVYIEKILKRSKELSIWMQNIQLAMMAIPISLCMVAIQDGQKVLDDGFMQGFDLPVFGMISLQSLGGIATAVVIKYADNILKAFAVAFGIILVTIASIFLFAVYPRLLFIGGAALVIGAVSIYSLFPYRKPDGRPTKVLMSASDLKEKLPN